MSEAAVLLMPLHELSVDLTISARAALPAAVIEDYTEAIRRGEEMPPAVAFRSGDSTWLADGFLRPAAYLAAGRNAMPVEVRPGSWRDAKMYAAGANSRHALQRTSACKRLAVLVVISDEEGKHWTQQQVASYTNVSVPLVKAVMALAKQAKTPEQVVEAKVEWSGTGKGMAQTPAEVHVPAAAKAKPAPTPAPSSRHSPMLTLDGCLDKPAEEEHVIDPRDEEEYESPAVDEEADEEDACDEEQLRERLLRAMRKTDRFASRLHLTLEEAVAQFREWQAQNPSWYGHHRKRADSPPPTPPE